MNDNRVGAIVLFGLLGIGLLLILSKPAAPATSMGAPLRLRPAQSRTYQNEETWEITWNEDLLPTKVTIHRNAVRT